MSKQNSTYRFISDYLNGSLSSQECALFEKKIEEDANFKQYFENHKLANALIIESENDAIKSQLSAIHKKEQLKKLMMKVLAFVVVFFLLILFMYFYENKRNEEEVTLIQKGTIPLVEKENIEINSNKTKKIEKKIIGLVKKEGKKNDNLVLDTLITDKSPIDSVNANRFISINPDTLEEANFKSEPLVAYNETKNDSSLMEVKQKKCEEKFWLPFQIDKIIPSQKTESNGAFVFSSIDENYSYSIDEGLTLGNLNKFNNLKPGVYNLIAIDKNGCKSYPQEVKIPMLETDFVIYPSQNQFWEIALESFREQDGVALVIYSAKSGSIVYRITLDNFQNNRWEGTASDGSPLPMGSYVYELKSKNKVIRGTVTIVK